MASAATARATARRFLRAAGDAVAAFLDELFPPVVASELARAREQGWSIDLPGAYCSRCGGTTGPGEMTGAGCSGCVGQPVAWDRIVRLGRYHDPVARWIVAMKFHKRWSWAPWLGGELAKAAGLTGATDTADATALRELRERTIVCPVPMPALRRWRRGFSQTHLMAQAFCQASGLREVGLLHRVGWQRPQTKVLRSQREANVRGAFRVDDVDLSHHDVWLIDDVKTSGATLAACTRLLRGAGARRIHVAVAAVVDVKRGDVHTL